MGPEDVGYTEQDVAKWFPQREPSHRSTKMEPFGHRRPHLPLVKIATRLSTLRRRRRRRSSLASTSTSSTSLHPKPSPAGAARAFPHPRRRIRPTRAGCSPAWTTRGDRLETRRPRLEYAGGDGVCPERDRRGGHHGTLGWAWVALSGSFQFRDIGLQLTCGSPG
jgi:hypothetical protein